jgi:hypothetical protein
MIQLTLSQITVSPGNSCFGRIVAVSKTHSKIRIKCDDGTSDMNSKKNYLSDLVVVDGNKNDDANRDIPNKFPDMVMSDDKYVRRKEFRTRQVLQGPKL